MTVYVDVCYLTATARSARRSMVAHGRQGPTGPTGPTGPSQALDFILLLFPNRMGFGSARTESHSVRLSVLPCQCSVYRLCSQRWN